MRQRKHLAKVVIHGGVILKWVFKKEVRKAWSGLSWLMPGKSGRLL
jgi:hypothetical protein